MKFKNKKIYVSGGYGFLGQHLVKRLRELGATVDVGGTSEAFDLTSSFKVQLLANILKSEHKKLDYIFHLAANTGAGDYTVKYPATQFYKNNLIHTNVLEMWKNHFPTAKFVAMGSTCMFPAKDVLKEGDFMSGPLHTSVDVYGFTRCLLTQGIIAYKRQHGLKGTTATLATLYGPGDNFDLSKAHVVTSLVKKFCDAVENGDEAVEIWGDGTQKRELIFVEDQVEGILKAADYEGNIINVGTGKETTIRELAETIKRLTGFEGNVVYNEDRFVGVLRKVLDISKAKEELGWNGGNTSLEDGLMKTIEWYRENK